MDFFEPRNPLVSSIAGPGPLLPIFPHPAVHILCRLDEGRRDVDQPFRGRRRRFRAQLLDRQTRPGNLQSSLIPIYLDVLQKLGPPFTLPLMTFRKEIVFIPHIAYQVDGMQFSFSIQSSQSEWKKTHALKSKQEEEDDSKYFS